jgi:hypothetical protein
MAKPDRYIIRDFKKEDAGPKAEEIDVIAGLTCEGEDGKVWGFAGVMRVCGLPIVFFNILDERARKPVLVHRSIKQGAEMAGRQLGVIYAVRDKSETTSERWLTKLGFAKMPADEKTGSMRTIEREWDGEGEFWRWQPSR